MSENLEDLEIKVLKTKEITQELTQVTQVTQELTQELTLEETLEEKYKILFLTNNTSNLLEDPLVNLININNKFISHNIFINNFNIYTEYQLDLIDFNNIFIAGSSVLASLYNNLNNTKDLRTYYNTNFSKFTIDLYLYDLTPKEAINKILHIYSSLTKSKPYEILIYNNLTYITFRLNVNNNYYRNINIYLTLYKSPSEILMFTQVDCFCVGYDKIKNNIYATSRGITSLETKTNKFNYVDLYYEYLLYLTTKLDFKINLTLNNLINLDPIQVYYNTNIFILLKLDTQEKKTKYINILNNFNNLKVNLTDLEVTLEDKNVTNIQDLENISFNKNIISNNNYYLNLKTQEFSFHSETQLAILNKDLKNLKNIKNIKNLENIKNIKNLENLENLEFAIDQNDLETSILLLDNIYNITNINIIKSTIINNNIILFKLTLNKFDNKQLIFDTLILYNNLTFITYFLSLNLNININLTYILELNNFNLTKLIYDNLIESNYIIKDNIILQYLNKKLSFDILEYLINNFNIIFNFSVILKEETLDFNLINLILSNIAFNYNDILNDIHNLLEDITEDINTIKLINLNKSYINSEYTYYYKNVNITNLTNKYFSYEKLKLIILKLNNNKFTRENKENNKFTRENNKFTREKLKITYINSNKNLNYNTFYNAIYNNETQLILKLAYEDINYLLSYSSLSKRSPLDITIEQDNLYLVKFILEFKLDIKINVENVILHKATRCFDYLVSNNIINLKEDAEGVENKSISLIIENSLISFLEIMRNNNILDLNYVNLAAQLNCPESLLYFIKVINLNKLDINLNNLLINSCLLEHTNLDTLRLILKLYPELLNEQDDTYKNKDTPLHLAARLENNSKFIFLLEQKDINLKIYNSKNFYVVHEVCNNKNNKKSNNINNINLLLRYDPNVLTYLTNFTNMNCLSLSIIANNNLTSFLLNSNLDIKLDIYNNHSLHYAGQYQNTQVLKYFNLLNVNQENSFGRTCRDYYIKSLKEEFKEENLNLNKEIIYLNNNSRSKINITEIHKTHMFILDNIANL
jgi:hypothetical protein